MSKTGFGRASKANTHMQQRWQSKNDSRLEHLRQHSDERRMQRFLGQALLRQPKSVRGHDGQH